MKRWQSQFHPMLRRIEALANEMTASGQEPRKHHLVPRFYLERWAEDGKIRATELDSKHTFATSPEKAARRTDFYRFEEGTYKSGSPIAWEAFLSVIEGRVSGTTQAIVDGRTQLEDLKLDETQELLWFLALQLTRGMNYRRGLLWTRVQEYLINYETSGDDSLLRLLLEGGYETTEENVQRMRQQLEEMRTDPTKLPVLTALKIKHSASTAAEIYPHLATRMLALYRTPKRLVTCDEPVVAVDEDMASNRGFGVANAPIVVYPLAPDCVLAMFHRNFPVRWNGVELLSQDELIDLNQTVLGNAYTYGFELPSQRFTEKLYIPPFPPPGERVTVARGPRGEELQRLTPGHRWRSQPQAPRRPVARWWRGL
jgi:hypothetical protein